jgi:hypothetical protein
MLHAEALAMFQCAAILEAKMRRRRKGTGM